MMLIYVQRFINTAIIFNIDYEKVKKSYRLINSNVKLNKPFFALIDQ